MDLLESSADFTQIFRTASYTKICTLVMCEDAVRVGQRQYDQDDEHEADDREQRSAGHGASPERTDQAWAGAPNS